jgi:hypothetical protein
MPLPEIYNGERDLLFLPEGSVCKLSKTKCPENQGIKRL